jgi:hypothetical protein
MLAKGNLIKLIWLMSLALLGQGNIATGHILIEGCDSRALIRKTFQMTEFADWAMHTEALSEEDALCSLFFVFVFQGTILDLTELAVFALWHS